MTPSSWPQAIPGLQWLLLFALLLPPWSGAADTARPWFLSSAGSAGSIEREFGAGPAEVGRLSGQQQAISPAQIGRQAAASIFNGRPPAARRQQQVASEQQPQQQQQQQQDWFQCVEPSRLLFEQFVGQYNRSFESSEDKLDRLNLFATTLRRTIMLNRIIQNEILNSTNYQQRPDSIRNYHFIAPLMSNLNHEPRKEAGNFALWYPDITDCELGLIKYTLFDIFYLIDRNDFEGAYKKLMDNSDHLPLLDDHGFEQLTNILLIRLYDRFRGDEKMLQLFQWPMYLKRMASFVYNLKQMKQANFKEKLSLIKFAYPAYFKDLKYNLPALNRTNDNLKTHQEHERFNAKLNRKFSSRNERNRRLAIFRQRSSYLDTMNKFLDDQFLDRWRNISFEPEWLRAYQADGTTRQQLYSEKLRDSRPEAQFPAAEVDFNGNNLRQPLKLTQFSDLSDAEFVAYLTNDFSLIEADKESGNFIDSNFPIRELNDRFRAELAHELEARRGPLLADSQWARDPGSPQIRQTLALARRVVDELIGDVGLPIGAASVSDVSEEEQVRMFSLVGKLFQKVYMKAGDSRPAGSSLSQSDLLDERQRRFEQFKQNYGRFKAWFIKEGWSGLSEGQLAAMLRLADLSWLEIKTILFRVCCLTEETLLQLSASNSSLLYMGSQGFLCDQMGSDDEALVLLDEPEGASQKQQQQQQQQATSPAKNHLGALELYYYYSVHFNKHQNDPDLFQRRLEIFKHNVDHIRRHSCVRGLSLFRSLKLKQSDSLSNIDTLDPRRSYTDDLNLDRFKYFEVPKLDPAATGELNSASADLRDFSIADHQPSRAGISYRRESPAFFSSLLASQQQREKAAPQTSWSYAERLVQMAQNSNFHSTKYRQNSVARIYDYVMQRYRLCLRTVGAPEPANPRQQCKSSGPLADQAAHGPNAWLAHELASNLQQQDQCSFYRQGLEPWAEGLIGQDLLSAQLIQAAKC